MKKQTKKLAIALLALSCASICVGAGLNVANPISTSITASAETTYITYNVDAITAESSSSATAVYITPADGDGTSFGVGDWDNIYTFEVGSGDGLKLNDTVLTTTDIKQPGSFFINLGVTAVAGDVLSIDGVYYNATTAKKIVFDNCLLEYNGTAWEAYIEYTTDEIGSLELHTNSVNGGAKNLNNVLYLQRVDGLELPIKDWETLFAYESGDGFKVNGETATLNEMKSTPDGLYFAFASLNANDVVSIAGLYVCDAKAEKYVIEESKFVWNGTTWELYVEYTSYELGEMNIKADSTQSAVYLTRADGGELAVNSWDYLFAFRQGSGNGVTLNGAPVTTDDIKSPDNALYINLKLAVSVGDVLKVGGTFYNVDTATAYVIEESTFIWDGTTWLSEFDNFKAEKKAALDEYKATFSQDDYYEAEWNSFATIVAEGKQAIDAATTEADANAALEAAKKAMDDVVTKTESDASFDAIKAEAKAGLTTYKSESDYKAAEWVVIQGIVTAANAQIDACESVTAINTAVTAAKSAMDAVKTAAKIDAENAVVATAKETLATYKTESDYKAEQWADIQAIITKANADIDKNIGDTEAINGIVTAAKAEIDKVKTAAVVDAETLVAKQASAKEEVRAYYNAIDHSLYSDEAETQISGYVSTAISAIENAKTVEEIDTAVAQFKTNVNGVAKIQKTSQADGAAMPFGCGSVIGGGLATGVALMAIAVAMTCKKKED